MAAITAVLMVDGMVAVAAVAGMAEEAVDRMVVAVVDIIKNHQTSR